MVLGKVESGKIFSHLIMNVNLNVCTVQASYLLVGPVARYRKRYLRAGLQRVIRPPGVSLPVPLYAVTDC